MCKQKEALRNPDFKPIIPNRNECNVSNKPSKRDALIRVHGDSEQLLLSDLILWRRRFRTVPKKTR